MCKTEYADVFLSHHVGTMGEHAKKLYEELCRRSIKTFICTSMKPGADFRQTITVNAVKCKLFVAFINEAWACSEECISEFNCALSGYNQAGSPKILPTVIGGFDWIDVVKYPNVFYIKANTNCCVLQGDNWDKVFQEIISTIESHLVKDERNSGSSAVNVTPGLQQGASQTSTEDFSPGDVVIIEQVDSKYGQKGWVLCAHRCFDRDKRNDGSTYVNLHADSSDRSAKKWKILKESDGSFIIKQDDTAYGQKDWVLCSHRVYNKDKRNNDSSFVIVHTDSSDRAGKKWNITKNSDGTYTIEQRDIKYGMKGYVLCAHRVFKSDRRNNDSTYVNVHKDSNDRAAKKWRIYRA